MDNPDDDKTIINVKGMPKAAWEAARRGSAQTGESMGTWLAGAINCRIAVDAGTVKPPDNKGVQHGNPPSLSPDQLTARIMAVAALQQSTAALKQATGRAIGRGTLSRCLLDLEDALPERRVIAGKAGVNNGKDHAVERQSGTFFGGILPPSDSPS